MSSIGASWASVQGLEDGDLRRRPEEQLPVRDPGGRRSVCGISRDELVQILQAENVLARRYFYPGCHRMEPYRSYYPHARLLLPIRKP